MKRIAFMMLTLSPILSLVPLAGATTLFLAGDSTMANKADTPDNPERGWGEALPWFLDGSVQVDNRALNGRSSLSFRTEGHWDKILENMEPGDWVLIQFGHNDEKAYDPSRYSAPQTDYRDNLVRFVTEVRARQGHPILATSIVRRNFNAEGNLLPTHGAYPSVVREVAAELEVPLLDLQKRTRDLVGSMGVEESLKLYLHPTAGKYAGVPDGKEDNTHLSLYGASVFAQLAIEEMLKQDLSLNSAIRQTVADFTSTEWIDLLPKQGDDTEEEMVTKTHVENVRNPQLGIFRSTLGKGPRPAVVVCPGGGYRRLSIEKEGYEVARWFNSLGIDAYVLKYRMKEFGYPAPLIDVTRAVRHLRSNAEKLDINPAQIGILGFSAGGHVAAMGTTLYATKDSMLGDTLDAVSARPDFSVLCYAVISMKDPYTHKGSRLNLLGEHPEPASMEAFSLENRVTDDTPPVFLFHTADDTSVPVENSLHFAASMARLDRPFALHVYPSAPHGIGMRPGYGDASNWPMALAGWLEELGLVWKRAE